MVFLGIAISFITLIVAFINHKKIILKFNGNQLSASIDIINTQENKENTGSNNNIDITKK